MSQIEVCVCFCSKWPNLQMHEGCFQFCVHFCARDDSWRWTECDQNNVHTREGETSTSPSHPWFCTSRAAWGEMCASCHSVSSVTVPIVADAKQKSIGMQTVGPDIVFLSEFTCWKHGANLRSELSGFAWSHSTCLIKVQRFWWMHATMALTRKWCVQMKITKLIEGFDKTCHFVCWESTCFSLIGDSMCDWCFCTS